jgi:uncharacterized protein with HEPN domain
MLRDEANLLDILKAARLALEFKCDLDEAAFLKDLKTQSAILHQLLIVGEAVKRLSSEFRDQHSQVPWRLISGMRDHLIHGYDDVDLGEVWRTLIRDLPALISVIVPLAPQQEDR